MGPFLNFVWQVPKVRFYPSNRDIHSDFTMKSNNFHLKTVKTHKILKNELFSIKNQCLLTNKRVGYRVCKFFSGARSERCAPGPER